MVIDGEYVLGNTAVVAPTVLNVTEALWPGSDLAFTYVLMEFEWGEVATLAGVIIERALTDVTRVLDRAKSEGGLLTMWISSGQGLSGPDGIKLLFGKISVSYP